MKRSILLLSAAQTVLMLVPATAHATGAPQQETPSTQDAPIEAQAPEAQERETQSAAGRSPGTPTTENLPAAPPTASADDIVVTGYRASLGTAQQIKRNSDAILDAVVAQDIGKLPDNTAAESLARITGIQVGRFSDEVNQVIVRGLPDVATTFNGRDIYTAENRTAALQDFPAGALAGLEVYKSATADLIEPGLAGLINVRSQRPFDFTEKLVVAGGIRGTYNDQTKRFDPLGNLLFSTRADTGIGEIGLLVNAAYTQAQYRNAVRWGSGNIVALDAESSGAITINPSSIGRNFRMPEAVGVYNDSGKRWRPAVNASVQWKPAENLEVYYDFLFQGYRGQTYNDLFEASLLGNSPTLTNVVLSDEHPDQVKSLTKVGGFRPQSFRSTNNAWTNTYQSAGGIKWNVGRAQLSTDLAFTTSRYGFDEVSYDMAMSSAPTIDVDFDRDGGVAFDLPGYDRDNPDNYIWRGYFNRKYRVKGSGWQWRGDLSLDTDIAFLPRLQFGYRWTDRDASLQNGDRYAATEPLRIGLGAPTGGNLEITQDVFRGDAQGWTGWLMPTRAAIADNAEQLRQASIVALQQLIALNPNDAGYRDALRRFSNPDVAIDPLQGFTGTEQTHAFYAQGKYEFELGSWRLDGLVGARIVNTAGRYSGLNSVTFNDVTTVEPRTNTQNYVDILPNFSLRIRPNDQLQMRLAYTQTRTRPGFGQLNPAVRLTQNVAPVIPNQPLDPRFPAELGGRPNAYGNGGNPDLQPLTSKNFDATVEYYFSKTASISAAAFYRDLFGFISNYTTRTTDPVYGLIEISRPENSGAAKIKGIEVSGQTFLDFLPGALSGFGVQANATYLDGEQRFPASIFAAVTGTDAEAPFVKIPGLSKWSYNAALFYEKGTISTRLSYNGRSAYLTGNFVNANGIYDGEGVRKINRLDFSFNWTPVKQVTLTFDAANLLAKPFENYREYDFNGESRFYPRDVRDEGRYFGLGARFRF